MRKVKAVLVPSWWLQDPVMMNNLARLLCTVPSMERYAWDYYGPVDEVELCTNIYGGLN